MIDTFYEQFLSANKSGKATALKLATIMGTIFVCLLLFLFFGMLFVHPAGVVIFLVVYMIKPRLNKEFEYSLSNFYFDVAIIYNKENRKELLGIDIREAEIFAPANSPRLNSFRPAKTLDFSSGEKDAKTFAFMIPVNKVLHKIIIEPDAEMLQFLKGRMGSRIYMD